MLNLSLDQNFHIKQDFSHVNLYNQLPFIAILSEGQSFLQMRLLFFSSTEEGKFEFLVSSLLPGVCFRGTLKNE
jgi:hypothetical protein